MAEWTEVCRAGKKPPQGKQPENAKQRRKRQEAAETSLALLVSGDDDGGSSREFLVENVRQWALVLKQSTFYQEAVSGMALGTARRRFCRIVSLGIGNFASSKPALLQLALALCLQKDFLEDSDEAAADDDKPKCVAYDPHFTPREMEACRDLGIVVPLRAENGVHNVAGKSTLFFMPHCPYRLYSSVLWQNWQHLSSVFIIGNSFSSYHLRSISPSMPLDCDCIRLLQSLTEEQTLWNTQHAVAPGAAGRRESIYPHMERAFADTSFHFFPEVSAGCVEGASTPLRPPLDPWPGPDGEE